MFTKRIEFANFTCTFGYKLAMLDLFEEIVWPSFKERQYKRVFKNSEYFFLDTQIIKIDTDSGTPMLCLSGKLIKNTKLKRDQIFREGIGIIDDPIELETAPSSLFVLILNNHRLLFVREVPGAPDISVFRTTSYYFLKTCHKIFIDSLLELNKNKAEANGSFEKQTRKSLVEKYPYPDLRITLLSDKQSLYNFIYSFDRIDELIIKLLRTNQEEINNDAFWAALDNNREKIHSTKATLQFSNRKEGLTESEVYVQCNSATKLGNSEIKLQGYDHYGSKLKGSNEDFHLSQEVKELSKAVKESTPILVNIFSHLIKDGAIKISSDSQLAAVKISELIGRFF